MTKDEITRLAMRDAETESPENLRAAADIYDRLIRSQRTTSAIMVQDDLLETRTETPILPKSSFS